MNNLKLSQRVSFLNLGSLIFSIASLILTGLYYASSGTHSIVFLAAFVCLIVAVVYYFEASFVKEGSRLDEDWRVINKRIDELIELPRLLNASPTCLMTFVSAIRAEIDYLNGQDAGETEVEKQKKDAQVQKLERLLVHLAPGAKT